MSVDILGTNCDQCRSFTSTETVRLIRTERTGRPPRLSHSSRTLGERDDDDNDDDDDDEVELHALGCRLTY